MTSRFLFALFVLLALRLPAQVQTELTADELEMVSTEEETRAVCVGNVVLTGTNLKIVCDRLEIIAHSIGNLGASIPTLQKFKYLLATGNVHVVQGDREATCGRAEVFFAEDKIVLTEDPVLLDRKQNYVQRGSRITLLRGEGRVHVEDPHLIGPQIQDLGPDAADEQPKEPAKAPAPRNP